jgi:hypothetical protein
MEQDDKIAQEDEILIIRSIYETDENIFEFDNVNKSGSFNSKIESLNDNNEFTVNFGSFSNRFL